MKRKYFLLLVAKVMALSGFAQNVGIGVVAPTQKLHVNGAVRVGNTNSLDTGTIRWNDVKKDFEGYVGDRWLSFTGGKSQWGNTEQYATENGGDFATSTIDTAFGKTIRYFNDRLAIAAPLAESGIYDHCGMVQVEKLYPSGDFGNSRRIYSPNYGNNYYFGSSISLSYNELVVGEPGALVDGNTQQGKAYVYKLDASNQPGTAQVLSQTGTNGDPFDKFGSTVAIAGDYIAVAASEKTVNANTKQGRVYTFRRLYLLGEPTDAFIPETNFAASDGTTNMKFGTTISLTPYCMAVGAPDAVVGGASGAGKVYIYRRSNNTWLPEATITSPSSNSNYHFGGSISINTAGDTLVVGETRPIGATGRVYIYVKNGLSWQYSATLYAQSEDTWNSFGCSVDFKNGRLLIGAQDGRVGINHQQGKAYLYIRTATGWAREASFTPQNGVAFMNFGASVQLGTDMVIVSAPGYVSPYFKLDKGSVYWFFNN